VKKDITHLEIQYIHEPFNLMDGYAHRPLDKRESAIVAKMADHFMTFNREDQHKLEAGFIEAFYKLAGQTVDTKKTKYMLLPSASLSLELVANYLRLRGLSLALVEPCLDVLVDIFKRHNIALEAIPDTSLEDEDAFEAMLAGLHSDAICLASPNNPTGICYTRRNFERLLEFCKEKGTLLILDTAFRLYKQPEDVFDEYRLLQESGIDYVVIEDTGKTWPTKQLKVSTLATSAHLFPAIFNIYTEFIFHHSPFVIGLLTEFINNSIDDGLKGVHAVANINRKVLYKALEGSVLKPVGRKSLDLAWLKIEDGVSGAQVEAALAKNRVFVLAGYHFFWNDKSKGEKFIRIPLARDPKVFAQAVEKLTEVLRAFS
jgi:aspartate/methionine/tyrosine aminotransferase